MNTDTTATKDTQKLQRAIVDGLEDVKAQDIQVFNTEHLTALFERVVVASGTSNRQTKALAASVRDAVRDAGFAKPRIEGEENGEWIIVDCGQAVVHIMQPSIRQYYHLEELWGEKPVRLKLGADKPAAKSATKPAASAKEEAKSSGSLKRSNAAKKGVADAFPSKAQLKKTAATKTPASKKVPAKKTASGKAPAKSPVKTVKVMATKPPAKKSTKAPAKKASTRKA
ncbi:MAG: ribosome silencing factor [Gammaproteobacteria bacterium]|nr:ribosome silencing factor [Gammaproteobacteria bacterium]MBU0788765.1 ribosome silencing factor [Gammaproteobacteria bacterium]MBU0814615.1 ribosome silencing factor [Gammaproteobacteria bacterium]MBU1786542.1 ribosome silencing factor [Gammaproteobacteria bacterium]